MPQLPDVSPSFGTLNNPLTPESSRPIATVSNPGQVAEAVGQVAKQQGQFADEMKQKQDEIDYTYAKSNYVQAAVEAQKTAELDPDYQAAPDKFMAKMNQVAQDTASRISSPIVRQQFIADQGLLTRRLYGDVLQMKVNKTRDDGIATTNQAVDELSKTIANSSSDAVRQAGLSAIQDHLNAAVKAGWMTEKQAEVTGKKIPQQLAIDQAKLLAASDPQKAIDWLSPTFSGAASHPNNLGNVKTAQGASSGTAEFAQPATPVDGVILTANNLRRGYQGLTLQQIGAKWAPSVENSTGDWVKNVSAASGLAPDQVPDLNDPAVLKNLLTGIATAEKSPKDRKLFTPDVLDQGIQASLAGKQPATQQTEGQTGEIFPKQNDIRDFIPPEERMQILRSAQTHADIMSRRQEQAMKQQQEQVMNDYLTKGLKGEPTADIADDKTLTFEQREHVLTALNNVAKNGEKTDPQLFTDLFQRIHARDDDPNRITSINDIIPKVGNGLSFADYEKLGKELDGKNTPEGKAEGVMSAQSLKVLKSQISGEDLYPGMKDPKGEEIYGSALPAYFKAIEDGKAKGISLGELYNPKSPNWAGNAVSNLKRDPATWYADMTASNLPDQNSPASPQGRGFWGNFFSVTAPEDTRAQQKLTEDLKSGKLTGDAALQAVKAELTARRISRQTAIDLATRHNLIRNAGDASPSAPQP